MSVGSYGVVRNIPAVFRSSDVKNFFSDFVENTKFKCFHFKHRPETIRSKFDDVSKTNTESTSAVKSRAEKSGTCCCVFNAIDEATLTEFIRKYNDVNWINRSGDYMKARCVVHRIIINSTENHQARGNIINGFLTRGEVSYRKRHAETEQFSEADLLALSELQPPTHVMPRGNVGTTTKEFIQLIRECKLPPRVIRKLDLKFPMAGSTRRYGNVNMTYDDASHSVIPGTNSFTANGDIIERISVTQSDQNLQGGKESVLENKQIRGNECTEGSGSDDDDDTGEEWERHEALHNDITSQERTKERLFEENIELKWEKGGSGLVFYTDAQFWNEQEGDFEEQNTDDWDIDMSEYYGERGDLDARQFLEIRREKMRGKAMHDDSLCDLKVRKRTKQRSRSESPPGKLLRGKFEMHTKGIGRRLMEKEGWKDGDPLGPQQKLGAITDPIELEGQNPNTKRGLGYHGEKLVRSNISQESKLHATKYLKTKEEKFWGPRSGEPQASHSPFFPQFAFNLSNDKFKERTKETRRRAVPGPDEGIVITTAYDCPLDIDSQDLLLRSKHPAALKHRKASSRNCDGPSYLKDDRVASENSGYTKAFDSKSAPLHLSSIKFVKGGILNAKR